MYYHFEIVYYKFLLKTLMHDVKYINMHTNYDTLTVTSVHDTSTVVTRNAINGICAKLSVNNLSLLFSSTNWQLCNSSRSHDVRMYIHV